jgi:hypothetical protein
MVHAPAQASQHTCATPCAKQANCCCPQLLLQQQRNPNFSSQLHQQLRKHMPPYLDAKAPHCLNHGIF